MVCLYILIIVDGAVAGSGALAARLAGPMGRTRPLAQSVGPRDWTIIRALSVRLAGPMGRTEPLAQSVGPRDWTSRRRCHQACKAGAARVRLY